MTTSKVTQIGLYAGTPQATGQVKNSSDEFSKIFASQSTQTERKTETKQEITADVEEVEKVESVSETTEDTSVNETAKAEETERTEQTEDTKNVTGTEETEDTVQNVDKENLDTEEVMEAITEIMATIQNVLGVTPEELQSALEELGLSVEDLLNTEMIPKIVVALTEGADELSVMTNAELYADIQEITTKVEGLINDVSKQMDILPESLKEMLRNMPQVENTVEEEVVTTVKTDNTPDVPVLEENRVQVSVERTETSHTAEDGRQGTDTGANQQMTFAQTVTEQIEQAVVAKTETTYSSYTTTQNIMNQIRDVIKVIQTQDLTEMELQLHPATLGNVRVQLSVTEGVLTASFTTENEAVKAALEAQMLVLKQNFEEQGIKVEAVEVTVASHAFERNLNSSENGAGKEQAPEKKKSGRRISLTELMSEVEEEALSDEDRIVAEMMRQNGNTVDYTV